MLRATGKCMKSIGPYKTITIRTNPHVVAKVGRGVSADIGMGTRAITGIKI